MFLWIRDGDRGSEIATLIEPGSEIYLNSVSVNILNESGKEFTLLLNLYTVDETSQLPGNQILRKQKIITSNQKGGWLTVDLTEERLVVNEPFFVSFQWVNVDVPVPEIGARINNTKNSLIRYRALGTWGQFAEWDIKVAGTSYK